jgi:hypothetical protein
MKELDSKSKRNIKNAFNDLIGEYYNSYLDGYVEYLPDSIEMVINEIYDNSVNNEYIEPGFSIRGKGIDIKFCGKENITNYIVELLKKDADVKELAEEKNWNLDI